jgi:hypothetical protein
LSFRTLVTFYVAGIRGREGEGGESVWVFSPCFSHSVSIWELEAVFPLDGNVVEETVEFVSRAEQFAIK